MQHDTFLELARTWKYAGIPDTVELVFTNPGTVREHWVQRVQKLLAIESLGFVEAYFSATLESAIVPGAVTYTLSGGRRG